MPTTITNLDRLLLEIKNINYPESELSIYLEENGLSATEPYDTSSNSNKRKIYITALSVLESLANQPQLMKSYRSDDINISDFAENIQSRIDQIDRKIRMMAANDNINSNNSTFMLFNS